MNRNRSPAAQWLVQWAAAVARQGPQQAAMPPWPASWRRLPALARYHEVFPLLAHAAAGDAPTMPQAARAALRRDWPFIVGRSLLHWEGLRQAVQALEAAGVPVLPLKGAVLGELLYREATLRPSVDIDLLVPWDQWSSAVGVLEALGYRRACLPMSDAFRWRHHKSMEYVRAGLCLELHWNFAAPRPNRIDPAFAWARASRRSIRGLEVCTLSWEDQLLTLTIHLRRNLQHLRLKHLLDLGLLMSAEGGSLDWAYVWRQAGALRLRRTLAYTLLLVEHVLDVPLPPGAQLVQERGWRRRWWLRHVGEELGWEPELQRVGRRRRDAALFKWTLMDSWLDGARSSVKYLWWRWDERRLRRRLSMETAPQYESPRKERQPDQVAPPEPPRMAAQPETPLQPAAPDPRRRPSLIP